MRPKLVLERNTYELQQDYAWCIKVKRGSATIWNDVSSHCKHVLGEAGADWDIWPFGWMFKKHDDAVAVMLAFS